jgi:membrane protein implicated in regulation of membrane protease activity
MPFSINVKKKLRTNAMALVDRTAKVTEPIQPQTGGIITVLGEKWRCKSADNDAIPIGSTVRIVGIEGVTLLVKRIESSGGEKHPC